MASTTIETRTYLNQSRAFCGSIKCPIRRLRYKSITIDPRQLDLKNVARILGVFNLEGCRRLELQNHVPALLTYWEKRRDFDLVWTQVPWRSWRDGAQKSRPRTNGHSGETNRTSSPPSLSLKHSLYRRVSKRLTLSYHPSTPFSKTRNFSSRAPKSWRNCSPPPAEHRYYMNSVNSTTSKRPGYCRYLKPLTAGKKKIQATQLIGAPIASGGYTHYAISLKWSVSRCEEILQERNLLC